MRLIMRSAIFLFLLFGVLSPVALSELVSYPLPNVLGCPTIHYWGDGCATDLYAANDHHTWKDHVPHYTWEDRNGEYQVNYVEEKGYECIKNDGSNESLGIGMDKATCIYADNYIPSLKVKTADSEQCEGDYSQTSNSTWTMNGSSLRLEVDGRHRDGTIRFKCFDGSKSLGYVSERSSNTVDRLHYGLNTVGDQQIYVVGGHQITASDFFKAFQIETAEDPTTFMHVWVMIEAPINDPVIITQMYIENATPYTRNDQAGAVVLKAVTEYSFSMRIAYLSRCEGPVKTEKVNVLMAKFSVPNDGATQVITGRLRDSFDVGHEWFRTEFSDTPICFVQLTNVNFYARALVNRCDRRSVNYTVINDSRKSLGPAVKPLIIHYLAILPKAENAPFNFMHAQFHVFKSGEVNGFSGNSWVFREGEHADDPLVFGAPQRATPGYWNDLRLFTASPVHATFNSLQTTCGERGELRTDPIGVMSISSGVFRPESPEDCIHLVTSVFGGDSALNMIMVYNGQEHDGRAVWQKVDEEGNLADMFLSYQDDDGGFFISSADAPKRYRVPMQFQLKRGCLEDGTKIRLDTSDGPVVGYLHLVTPVLRGSCVPTFRGVSHHSKTGAVQGEISNFYECARQALEQHRRHAAVTYSETQCTVIDHAEKFDSEENKKVLSCIAGCVKLPGRGKALKKEWHVGRIRVSWADSLEECASHVRYYIPDADGAVYDKIHKICYANRKMASVDASTDDLRSQWQSCFVQYGVKPKEASRVYKPEQISASPSNLVPYPLANLLGCPAIHYWGEGCTHDLYASSSPRTWTDLGGRHKVTYTQEKGYQCFVKVYDLWKSLGTGGMDKATCIYADNNCPSLSAKAADYDQCKGEYQQTSNSTWTIDGSSLRLEVDGRHEDGTIRFKCVDGAKSLGYVSEHECGNDVDRLQYGMNTFGDQHVYVVGSHQITAGDFFKAFKIPTAHQSTHVIHVWIMNSSPIRDPVVITQSYVADDSGRSGSSEGTDDSVSTDRTAAVVLKAVSGDSFRLSVVYPSNCLSGVVSAETIVNILMAEQGLYKDDMTSLFSLTMKTGSRSGISFYNEGDHQFPVKPVCLTQLNDVDIYARSEVADCDRRALSFRVVFDTKATSLPNDFSLGYLAMATKHTVEHFDFHSSRFSIIYGFGFEDESLYQYPLDHVRHAHSPLVFAATQYINADLFNRIRIGTADASHVMFRAEEDTCGEPGGLRTEHFGAISISSEGFQPKTPEDCLVTIAGILGGDPAMNMIMKFTGETYNDQPVWRAINGKPYELFFSTDRLWTINTEKKTGEWLLDGAVSGCFEDGVGIYQLNTGAHLGSVHLAMPAVRSSCVPTAKAISYSEDAEVVRRSAENFMECARQAFGQHPTHNAVWYTDKECVSVEASDVKYSAEEDKNVLSCIPGCVKLTGRGKELNNDDVSDQILVSRAQSLDECASHVRYYFPDAYGAVYDKIESACYASRRMASVDGSTTVLATEWESCFVQLGVEPKRATIELLPEYRSK